MTGSLKVSDDVGDAAMEFGASQLRGHRDTGVGQVSMAIDPQNPLGSGTSRWRQSRQQLPAPELEMFLGDAFERPPPRAPVAERQSVTRQRELTSDIQGEQLRIGCRLHPVLHHT